MKVRQQAIELAKSPATGLAVRVTALSIAAEGGGSEVKSLAADRLNRPDTPVILRKVAERCPADRICRPRRFERSTQYAGAHSAGPVPPAANVEVGR